MLQSFRHLVHRRYHRKLDLRITEIQSSTHEREVICYPPSLCPHKGIVGSRRFRHHLLSQHLSINVLPLRRRQERRGAAWMRKEIFRSRGLEHGGVEPGCRRLQRLRLIMLLVRMLRLLHGPSELPIYRNHQALHQHPNHQPKHQHHPNLPLRSHSHSPAHANSHQAKKCKNAVLSPPIRPDQPLDRDGQAEIRKDRGRRLLILVLRIITTTFQAT